MDGAATTPTEDGCSKASPPPAVLMDGHVHPSSSSSSSNTESARGEVGSTRDFDSSKGSTGQAQQQVQQVNDIKVSDLNPVAVPIPAFLQRLMEDNARQLRRRARGGDDEMVSMATQQQQQQSQYTTNGTKLSGPPSTSFSEPKTLIESTVNGVDGVLNSSDAGSTAARSLDDVTQNVGNYSYNASLTSSTLPSTSHTPAVTNSTNTIATGLTASSAAAAAAAASSTAMSASNLLRRLEDVYSPPREIAPEEALLPPENFAMVSSFVYRSSFPKRKNFPFLRSLGLKSVL